MNLEPVMRSKVGPKEKNAHLNTCLGESRKMALMTLSAGSNGDADMGNGLADSARAEEAGAD